MSPVAKTKTTKSSTSSKKTSRSKSTSSAKSGDKALVIVESPAKSKTIKKILGANYTIEASYGHVRDLSSKNELGFDVNNKFEPSFVILPEKKKVVTKLNTLAKSADKIFLASDPDREGEAIAWHVKEVLKVPDDKVYRIEFNEITPKAVKYAVEHSRQIDMDKVRAQQTRQILDKLVGFRLSPVLWKQLGNYHLSAGRVQSVALRMICEREEEIEAFVPTEYWSITVQLEKDGKVFDAELVKYAGSKIEINNEEEASNLKSELEKEGLEYVVTKISKRETTRKPTAPFITSTLQREASSKLNFGVSKTMQVAQKLYEGIEIDGTPVGLITYMRTDSVRISDDAQVMAKDFIMNNYGEKYYPSTPNVYGKAKKNVQDAHEAIRPSYPERTPESIKPYLDKDQYNLYRLIWNKFMSSQMAPAKIANKNVEITAGDCELKTGTSKVVFDGFLKLYKDTEEADISKIPDLKEEDKLERKDVIPKQHFTQPPPRYSEASLVKALEEYGIGRPSTYASIITKIQQRKYVEKQDKALFPTFLGKTVSKQLVSQFTDIMDYAFTASMEEKLDLIADKKAVWNEVLQEFYDPFIENVNEVMGNAKKVVVQSDVKCPNCGKPMIVRTSRFGSQFLGCSGYPDCKTILSLDKSGNVIKNADQPEKSDQKCEKCGGDLYIKLGPYGRYTECEKCKDRKSIVKTTGVTCPKCGKGEIIERKSKRGVVFFGCNKYPDCDFVLWNEPTGEKCPKCGSLLVKRTLKSGDVIECSNRGCGYKKTNEDE